MGKIKCAAFAALGASLFFTAEAGIAIATPTGEVTTVICAKVLPRPEPFTIAFRFKASPYVYDRKRIGKEGLVFASGNGYDHGFRATIRPEMDNSLNGYRMSLSFALEGGRHASVGVPGIITTGRQYAIAFVWDGQEVRSYLNGAPGARSKLTGYVAPRHPFTIGPAGYGVGFYPFSVENFTVWQQVFSDDQILAIATGLAAEDNSGSASAPQGVTDPVKVMDYLLGLDATQFSDMRTLAWTTARKLVAAGERKKAAKLYRLLAERAPSHRDHDGGNALAAEYANRYGERGVVPALPSLKTVPPAERGGCTLPEVALVRMQAKYVAPDGDDAKGDGSRAHPFATLAKAIAAVRGEAVRQIVVRGGRYSVDQSIKIGSADSGTEGKPLVIAAEEGETPVFDGGREITGFRPCGRGKILCADIAKAGVNMDRPKFWGYAVGAHGALDELCEGDEALNLARHPNQGFLLTHSCDRTNRTFKLDLPDLKAWAAEPELMALSYMRWYWGDETTFLTVNPADGTMHLDLNRVKVVKNEHPVKLLNSLKALDEPGEWFLDHGAAKLYYWPRQPGARVEISNSTNSILVLERATNVVIRGLVFQATRATGVRMTGAKNVRFSRNIVRNCGSGLYLRGEDIEISDCGLKSFSGSAIVAYGGNRKTLKSSGIRILRNDISDVGRRKRTYQPCVHAEGCGIEIAGNHMHDTPSSAVRLEGNDHLINSNLVERCVLESDDQGAVDIYANPGYAGIEIIGNTWRDIGRAEAIGDVGQAAVRFDDVISGVRVRLNRFYNCGYKYFGAVQINGGRFSVVDNNLFVNCRKDVTINIRLPEWWREIMTKGRYWKNCLAPFKPDSEPYLSRYPDLKDIADWPCLNFVSRCLCVGTRGMCRRDGENGNLVLPAEPTETPEGYEPFSR